MLSGFAGELRSKFISIMDSIENAPFVWLQSNLLNGSFSRQINSKVGRTAGSIWIILGAQKSLSKASSFAKMKDPNKKNKEQERINLCIECSYETFLRKLEQLTFNFNL
jgi:hypothetical protein